MPTVGVRQEEDRDRTATGQCPVTLEGTIEATLSRWLWLVKWLLIVPHLFVLVLPVGRLLGGECDRLLLHPVCRLGTRGPFSSSTWESSVGHGVSGSTATRPSAPIATRRSRSPTSLTIPAHLDIAYPERLSRGLVLVSGGCWPFPSTSLSGSSRAASATAWSEQRQWREVDGRRPYRAACADRCRHLDLHRQLPTVDLRLRARAESLGCSSRRLRRAHDR